MGLIARSPATLAAVRRALGGSPIGVSAHVADVADEGALCSALDGVVARFGVPDVLVYNAALARRDRVPELTAFDAMHSWAVNVVGAVTAVGPGLPSMVRRGRGTVLLAGGLPAVQPEAASLSLGKAGLKALAGLLAADFDGIHVASVSIWDRVVSGTAFDPDCIAETYWQIYTQHPEDWKPEVHFSGADAVCGRSPARVILRGQKNRA